MDTGMFGVYAGVQSANVRRTIELIRQTMHQMRTTAVDADRLQDAKEYTKGNLYLAAESVDNQMVRLAQNEIHFNTHIPLSDVIKQVESVCVDEIQDLARQLFEPEQMALTLLGPVEADMNLN
jgi:predicted Zn-dependent peptidase